MKRLIALALALILILPCAIFAGAEEGTSIAPLAADTILSDWDELVAWAQNGSDDTGKTVALDADITAPAGASWTAKAVFAGSFDGQSHKITLPAGTDGLFGQLKGNVSDLRLYGDITYNESIVGILTDQIAASLTVKNVMVEGSVTLTKGDNAGAFAGQMIPSHGNVVANFVNCINAADVFCNQRYASGFVGNNESNYTNFTDCLNLGNVTVEGATGEPITSGFAGALYSGGAQFVNCVNLGTITDNGSSAKGSCAFAYRSHATGNLSYTGCLALQGSADRLALESMADPVKGKYQWLSKADAVESLSALHQTWVMAEEDGKSFPVPAAVSQWFDSVSPIPEAAPEGGSIVTTPEGLEFTVNGKQASLTSYFGNASSLVIPATVNGASVVRIEASAFAWCDSLYSVTLPSSLTYIAKDAFHRCNRLAEIINLSSLNIQAGSEAHGGVALCAELVHKDASKLITKNDFVFLKSGGTYVLVAYTGNAPSPVIPTLDAPCQKIGSYAFAWNGSLLSLTVPEGVTAIGDWAFAYCEALSEIDLPSSLKTVGEAAFRNCGSLLSLVLPAGLTRLDAYAFSCCYSLTKMVLPAGIDRVSSSLFSGCEALESVTLPSAALAIGDNAFYDCYALKSMTLPSMVSSIGKNAFYNCRALESLTVAVGMTDVGEAAFAWCNSFTKVYYGGTEAQWKAISVGADNIEWNSVSVEYSYEHKHSFGNWEKDGETHWKTCSTCGEICDQGKHSLDANATCTTCGYVKGAFLPGDANGDSSVTFSDIQRIYQHLSTSNKISGTALSAADANGDGSVTFSDIQRIYQHLSGGNKLF